MSQKCYFRVFLLVAWALHAQPLLADGCFVSDNYDADVYAPDQKVVISWDGKTQTMVLATKVRSNELANFGWIIPIRATAKPRVELGNIQVFFDLSDYFKPPRPQKWKLADTLGTASADLDAVEVLETKELDIYDITVLRATDSDQLYAWLRANDFRIEPEFTEMLAPYTNKEHFFVTAKIDLMNEDEDDVDLIRELTSGIHSPLKIAFRTGQPFFPLKISSANEGWVHVTAYILGPKPMLDSRGVLRTSAWKKLSISQRAKMARHIPVRRCRAVTKLTFTGQSSQFNSDAHFRAMTIAERRPFFQHHPGMWVDYLTVGVEILTTIVFLVVLVSLSIRIFTGFRRKRDTSNVGKEWRSEPVKHVLLEEQKIIAFHGCFVVTIILVVILLASVTGLIMTGKRRQMEKRLIVLDRLYAARGMDDVNAVRDLLREYPNVSKLFDDHASFLSSPILHERASFRPTQDGDAAADVLRLFLQHGFDVNARGERGRTALHHLAKKGIPRSAYSPAGEGTHGSDLASTVRILLDAGAQVNMKDDDGKTPLHHLAAALVAHPGVSDITELLLDAGAQVNLKDDAGQTALHVFATKGVRHPDLMRTTQLLLDAGAQVNPEDNEGKTALDYLFSRMMKSSHPAPRNAATLLIRHGAILRGFDPNDLSRLSGHVAALVLTAAAESGNRQLIDYVTKARPIRSVDTVCNEAWEFLRRIVKPQLQKKAFDELKIARLFAPSDNLVLSLLGIAQYRCKDPNALNTLERARVIRAREASESSAGLAVASGRSTGEPSLAARVADLAAALEIELSLYHSDRVIDERTLAGSPALQSMLPSLRARNPDPADGAEGAEPPFFNWVSGNMAVRHNVYFGTHPNLGADDLVVSRRPVPMFAPHSELTPGQTYYWRVDELTETGRLVPGEVWTFTAR